MPMKIRLRHHTSTGLDSAKFAAAESCDVAASPLPFVQPPRLRQQPRVRWQQLGGVIAVACADLTRIRRRLFVYFGWGIGITDFEDQRSRSPRMNCSTQR